MKKVRFLIEFVLIMGICFICLPSKSASETDDIIILPEHLESQSIENSVDRVKPDDKDIFIYPNINCDPKFLIPGNPNIDTGFLIKDWPTGK